MMKVRKNAADVSESAAVSRGAKSSENQASEHCAPALSAEDLSASYGAAAVLDGISFRVLPGQILTLIGPNGAGKSTLLKTAAGQLTARSGRVLYLGRDMAEIPIPEAAKERAVLLTGRHGAEFMTCREAVECGRYPYTGVLGSLSEKDREAVRSAMERTGTLELSERMLDAVSDGQRQRVLLAGALCQEPEILILDEPTSYLDAGGRPELLKLIRDLAAERHMAVLMSLHELDLAGRISDLLLCVKNGKCVRLGTPEEIFDGRFLRELYDIREGSWPAAAGSPEFPRREGAPRVFVIPGGGSGRNVFRKLWREGIPFAAGVLPESDLDYPEAAALAAALFSIPAFTPVSPEMTETAAEIACGTERVIVCPGRFGSENRANRNIARAALEKGIPVTNPDGSPWNPDPGENQAPHFRTGTN